MARRLGVDITLPSVSPQLPTPPSPSRGTSTRPSTAWATPTTSGCSAPSSRRTRTWEADVLAALAVEVGLDEAGFRAALADGTYRARHQEALREAAAHQVRSVPTLLVGDIRIEGVPRPAQLRKAILDARARQDEEAGYGAACGIDGTC